MPDPGEAICDALVAFIEDHQAGGSNTLSLHCSPKAPEDILAELKRESEDLQLFFTPYAETEEKIGRGGQALEEFVVSAVIAKKLSDTFTRKKLFQFVRELRVLVRGQRMAGYVYSNGETATKYNPDDLHENNRFQSVVRFYYRTVG